MENKEFKFCPMMSNRYSYGYIGCDKGCAWYDRQHENCCIFSIMKHVELMTEVCDGSRTLFVREC